jgi:hypothetical protein
LSLHRHGNSGMNIASESITINLKGWSDNEN